jgi:tRNA nucleotidyltransferase/poly(A) polymerase
MKLREFLNEINALHIQWETSTPFVCGGTPRDKFLGKLKEISDLDITTGDKSIFTLANIAADNLGKKYNLTFETKSDGHSTMLFGNLSVDFSSNFNVPNISSILNNMGIENPTELQKEMFSRDFTCNSLLCTFDLKNTLDPTKRGIKDLENKIIDTCLSPHITLMSHKNRVIRLIYLATKLNFDIHPRVLSWVSENPISIQFATPKSLIGKLVKSAEYNKDKTAHLLTKMNLWPYVPVIDELMPYYKGKK